MKRIYLFVTVLIGAIAFGQLQNVGLTLDPSIFEEDEAITVRLAGNSIDESQWGLPQGGPLYLWMWQFPEGSGSSTDSPTNGAWTDSNEAQRMTYNAGDDSYTFTFTPTTLYQTTNIAQIGMLVKHKDGSNSRQSQDFLFDVGGFQFTSEQPLDTSVISRDIGQSISLFYQTSQNANWELKVNGTVTNTASSTNLFFLNYQHTADALVEVVATNTAGDVLNSSFMIFTTPNVVSEAMPAGTNRGINYLPDTSKVRLALYAPNKDYVHVMGSFNDYSISSDYLMKRDTGNSDVFWIELDNLNPNEEYYFQYRDNEGTMFADPYSHLLLSDFDDQFIPESVYPGLPDFPQSPFVGFELTVLETNKPAYPWSDFTPPAKEDLIIYELLVRDFDPDMSYQSLIDNFDYFKNLNVNAIELMPIMEFDGNDSWGYNPTHHAAMDKAYGTEEKLKEFIDLCHQNGIAVILDVAYNHATRRTGLVRMWNGGGGLAASPTSDNPYFNTEARHSFNVFEDFNHQSQATRDYVKASIRYWIEEFNIDGYRYDLTKGFTQNCSGSDDACTNAFHQDRVDVLIEYADYQWSIDDDSYVIFEHLGTGSRNDGANSSAREEVVWANYRANEGKGIMFWGKAQGPYKQNILGFASDSNFDFMDFENVQFNEPRLIGYPESHDEERLAYEAQQFGNDAGNVKNEDVYLNRLKAIAATSLTIPGPKMFWQFMELGYDFSINYCIQDGSIQEGCRVGRKPIPEDIGYDTAPNRLAVYDDFAKIIGLRTHEDVFKTKNFTVESGDLTPNIYISNNNFQPSSELSTVIVVANFTVSQQNIQPFFSFTGEWFDLMDETSFMVNDTNMSVSLQPGEYKIYGNQASTLSTTDLSAFDYNFNFEVSPNPVTNGQLNLVLSESLDNATADIYDANGRLVQRLDLDKFSTNQSFNVGLGAGIYFVEVKTQDKRAVRKIVVQ